MNHVPSYNKRERKKQFCYNIMVIRRNQFHSYFSKSIVGKFGVHEYQDFLENLQVKKLFINIESVT